MGRWVLWAGGSYGPVHLMGRCVLWAGASYGPMSLMGRCALWAGKYDTYVATEFCWYLLNLFSDLEEFGVRILHLPPLNTYMLLENGPT